MLCEPQVLRRAPPGDHQGVVGPGLDLGETGVKYEVMPRLFRVCLIALEIMNCRLDLFPRLFVRAHRMNHVPDHRERLKRHHDLVILGEVADQKQDLLRWHVCLSLDQATVSTTPPSTRNAAPVVADACGETA